MMVKKIIKIMWIIIAILLGVIVFLNIGCFVKRKVANKPATTFCGLGNAIVSSGSMEDYISINDMVVFAKCQHYEKNDVITYNGKNNPVTHRIVSSRVDENGNVFYITKGDANNTEDSEITANQVVGKVFLVIPYLGVVRNFIVNKNGYIIFIIIGLLIILLPEILKKKEKGEKCL